MGSVTVAKLLVLVLTFAFSLSELIRGRRLTGRSTPRARRVLEAESR